MRAMLQRAHITDNVLSDKLPVSGQGKWAVADNQPEGGLSWFHFHWFSALDAQAISSECHRSPLKSARPFSFNVTSNKVKEKSG